MSWSAVPSAQIIEEFWQNRHARCPDDNGPLKLRLRKLRGGDYHLLAECLVCGKSKAFRRGDDPRRRRFRQWTAAEMEELGQVALRDEQTPCPVCETLVETHRAPASVIPALIRCFRCGNSNQWGIFTGELVRSVEPRFLKVPPN